MKLLLCCLLGGTISSCTSFTIPITTSLTSGRVIKYHGSISTKSPTNLSSTNNDNSSTNKSNLQQLLPKQKRQTIPLDKYGRRIHDLKSDGMPKYSVSGSSNSGDDSDKSADIGISTYGEEEDMAAPMLR